MPKIHKFDYLTYSIITLNKNKFDIDSADDCMKTIELYAEYCNYNKIKIRRERINIIISFFNYKHNGLAKPKISIHNRNKKRLFLFLFIPSEKHIINKYINELNSGIND